MVLNDKYLNYTFVDLVEIYNFRKSSLIRVLMK
jgi:hypothetical protein